MSEVEEENRARQALIRKQAADGDPVCAELLALQAQHHTLGGGYSWIDTQLDMEDAYDDFRPY